MISLAFHPLIHPVLCSTYSISDFLLMLLIKPELSPLRPAPRTQQLPLTLNQPLTTQTLLNSSSATLQGVLLTSGEGGGQSQIRTNSRHSQVPLLVHGCFPKKYPHHCKTPKLKMA